MKYFKQKNIQQKGQTLIETMTGLFILVTGIASAVSLAIYAFGSSNAVLNQIVATGLAREGLEVVRNMRDTNWLNDTLAQNSCYNFSDPTGTSNCYPNWLGDQANSSVPFCLNPSFSSGNPQSLSGSAWAAGNNNIYVFFNGSPVGTQTGYRNFSAPTGALHINSLTFNVGKNVFAVQANTDGESQQGFLADITMGSAETGTGPSWKAYKPVMQDWYTPIPPPDQTGPGGTTLHWTDVGYDDSSWSNATDLGPFAGSYWQTYPYATPTGVPNMPYGTPGHWIWHPSHPYNYQVFLRGTYNNTNCSGNLPDVPVSYNLSFNSANSNPWSLSGSPNNFGLSFNDPTSSSSWNQNGFYSSSGAQCNNSGGSSSFCRSVILTKLDNVAPYNLAITAGDKNFYLLKVQSQVWWTDKRCPSSASFAQASNSCKVELDSYLTNWKS